MRRYLVDARASTPHFPGIARTIEGLLPALVAACAADEEIVVLTPRAGTWSSVAEEVVSARSPLAPRQHVDLPRLIRRLAPAVYHSPYVTLPLRPGAPSVVTINDVIPLQQAGHLGPVRTAVYRTVVTQALWSARRVLVPSEATARAVRDRRPRRPVDVVPHGVDAERFTARPAAEVTSVRSELGLDRPFVLTVAGDRPHKNLDGLVDAWSRTHASGHDLVVVGAADGPQAAGTRYLGRVEDDVLVALYTAAEVAVTASHLEGFGLPVLEAMASGTPVVCSDIGPLREVAGDAATYVDPADPASISAGLHALLGDPALRRDRAEAGRRRARSFSWTAAATATLDSYRRAG